MLPRLAVVVKILETVNRNVTPKSHGPYIPASTKVILFLPSRYNSFSRINMVLGEGKGIQKKLIYCGRK